MAGLIDDNFRSMFGSGAAGNDSAPTPAANMPAVAAQQTGDANQGGRLMDDNFKQMFGAAQQQAASQPNSGMSPETAGDVSPVGFIDRAKLSLGNDAGKLGYLKQKFDDARQLPNGNFVVKQAGKWSQVDPSGMGGGDPWTKAKELAKDVVADMGDVAINAGATMGALGAAPFTGGTSIAVAGAAGAGSGAIRTSLGRAVGTYEATPEEQLKDIGLEALLNAGGQTLALGARPVLKTVTDSVKSFASTASEGTKKTMSWLLGATTGADKANMDRLMERAPQVMGMIDGANATKMATQSTEDGLKQTSVNYTKGLFQKAGRALGSNFDEIETNLLQSVPKDFSVNPSDIVKKTMDGMVQSGLAVAREDGTYKMAPAGKLMSMLQHAEGNGAMNQEALAKMGEFVRKANELTEAGTLKGSDAAEALMSIRRGFDKFYYKAVKANPEMKQFLTPVSASLRNEIVQGLEGAGTEVATKYANMNQFYTEMMPHVAEAERIMRRVNGPEAFVNRLMNGKDVGAKNLVDIVAGLKGKTGTELADTLKDSIAAGDFVSRLPKISMGRAGAAAAAGAGASVAGMGPLAAIVGAPVAAASSPRLVGRSLQYAQQLGDFLKAIPPEQMKEFVAHPELFSQAVRTTVQAMGSEDSVAQQLLQSHGIPVGGQQQPQPGGQQPQPGAQ